MRGLQDQYLGKFRIGKRSLFGRVRLSGPNSSFEVHSESFIHLPEEKMATIRGVSTMGENITIINAIRTSVNRGNNCDGKSRETLSLFPHYVAVGPRHLPYGKKVISCISFTTTGARNLFYDIGAFGSAIGVDATQFLPDWARVCGDLGFLFVPICD